MATSNPISAFQISARAALSAALALGLAEWMDLPYPTYAMIGAVIVMELSPRLTRELALRRLVGTVLGAMVGAALSYCLPQGPWAIGLGIFAGMFLTHILRMEAAAKVAGYVCGIVMLDHSEQPWSYALYRLEETVLGIAVAVMVSFLPKLTRGDAGDERVF